MKLNKLAVMALSTVVALSSLAVEAKRLGGGKSTGASRPAATQQQSTAAHNSNNSASTAAPAAAKPAAAAPSAAAAPVTPPKTGLAKWMPMLGGLALGAALGSMFGGGAMGAAIANILMFLALGLVALMAWRWFAARRAANANGGAGTQPAFAGAGFGAPAAVGAGAAAATGLATARTSHEEPRYIGGGSTSTGSVTIDQTPSGSTTATNLGFAPQVPAGFDVTGFALGSKAQFNRLQAAFDKGDASVLHDMLTAEMYAEVDRELKARGPNSHPTEVVTLEADVVEVTTEADAHWASVRFHGLIREDGNEKAENFDEIWNLTKALDGKTGWLLAGIQQI